MLALLITVAAALTLQVQTPPAESAAAAHARAQAYFEKNENTEALAAFDQAIALDPSTADSHVGRARTLARLRRYDEAFVSYGEAARLAPGDAMVLRYRGHNYINVRKLDLALADLTKAESMKKDDFGIYYHLALAHYLAGQFDRAAAAYEGCVRTAASDEDRVSCWAWQVPSLLRSSRQAEARAILDKVTPDLAVTENASYLDRLLLFKGVKSEDEVGIQMQASALNLSTVGYGLGLWHLIKGRSEQARAYFDKATSGDYWPAFGFIAAEMELKRMK